ncbi:MAG: hypothetical protein IT384_06730 [Deltaproteobacteria bacterium]|nr:hypothetical protein [Deltaproteobacteria bacterium]
MNRLAVGFFVVAVGTGCERKSETFPSPDAGVGPPVCGSFAGTITWTDLAPMPTPRFDFGTAVVAGKIYTIGGFSGRTEAIVEVFDPIANQWTTGRPMPIARRSLVATAVGTKIYVTGGHSFTDQNNLTYHRETHIYDVVSDAWTSAADLPYAQPLNGVMGNLWTDGDEVGGLLLAAVHNNFDAQASSSVFVYDARSARWTQIPAGGFVGGLVNYRFTTAGFRQRLYALSETTGLTDFDPATQRSTVLPAARPRETYATAIGAALVGVSDRLLLIGGLHVYSSSSAPEARVQSFDVTNQAWTDEAPLARGRYAHRAVAVGCAVVVIGGTRSADQYFGAPVGTVEVGTARE